MQRIIRRRDLKTVTGFGPTKVYELIGEGEFPKPIPLGGRSVGWLETEIAAWQAERIAERDAKAAA